MTEQNQEKSKESAKGFEAYDPDEIARQVMDIGVKKTRYPAYKTFTLGVMGGAFISFGAMYELYILSHPDIGSSIATLVAPLFYAVGYIIAFIAGAEIFTTNNLSAMGWASGKLKTVDVAKNWTIVLFANFFWRSIYRFSVLSFRTLYTV